MNDINDVNQIQPDFEPQPDFNTGTQPAGFCQHCGRPLTSETIRKVGQAVYCEPCLAARIGTPQPSAQPGAQSGYAPVNPAYGPAYGTGFGSWTAANAAGKPGPNPGLAALLGLIPGVGAMYNEQYAKGIVHLVVFAVLVSLADHVNNIFGLFVAGWIAYMAIEAHHTARARRDGTPLPNPFGLNDVGERLGFGKSWPSGPSVAEVANDAAAAATAQATAGFNAPAPGYPPPFTPSAAWGAAPETYAPQPAPGETPFTRPYFGTAYPGYAPVPPVVPIFDPKQRSRFPAGAVWLIGLGTVFLLSNTGIFNDLNFRPEAVLGTVLVGIAVWVFLTRMTAAGASLANDYTPGYTPRLLSALTSTLWIALLGILFLLDGLNLFGWHHAWPLLIILPGVLALIRRASEQALANSYLASQNPPASSTGNTETTGGSL